MLKATEKTEVTREAAKAEAGVERHKDRGKERQATPDRPQPDVPQPQAEAAAPQADNLDKAKVKKKKHPAPSDDDDPHNFAELYDAVDRYHKQLMDLNERHLAAVKNGVPHMPFSPSSKFPLGFN